MPKPEEDLTVVAEQHREGTAPAKETDASSGKRNTNHTVPDDIPAVHVLVAAQDQDRKEAQNLLLGFDKPNRAPKRPPLERDFVDYYATKKSKPMPPPKPVPNAMASEEGTLIHARRHKESRPWILWTAIVVAMAAFASVVTALAISTSRPTAEPVAATTVHAAPPVEVEAIPSRALVPPPAPAEVNAAAAPTSPGEVDGTSLAAGTPREPATKRSPKIVPSTPNTAARGAAAVTVPTSHAALPAAPTHRSTRSLDASPSTTSGRVQDPPPPASSSSPALKPPPRDDFIRTLE